MKKVVWIGHYIEESDICLYNNIAPKSDAELNKAVAQYKGKDPYVFAKFAHKQGLFEFSAIVCPYLPKDIAAMNADKKMEVMSKAIDLANAMPADQVAIAALFASIWEDGGQVKGRSRAPLTTGKNLIMAYVSDYIDQAFSAVGKDMAESTVSIVGYGNKLSQAVLDFCKNNFKRILVDGDLGGAGIPKAERAPHKTIFEASDAIIVNTSGFGLGDYISSIKPGTIVCDLIVPFFLTKEIVKTRKDIFAFEGVWARFSHMQDYEGEALKRIFSSGLMPACVGELMILALENKFCEFSLGDNINLANAMKMHSMARRQGFESFGYKQGKRVYSKGELEQFQYVAQR